MLENLKKWLPGTKSRLGRTKWCPVEFMSDPSAEPIFPESGVSWRLAT